MRLYSAGDGDLGRREFPLPKFNFGCRAILCRLPVNRLLCGGYFRSAPGRQWLTAGGFELCE